MLLWKNWCILPPIYVFISSEAVHRSWILILEHVYQKVKNPPAMQETLAWSLGWEDPLEEGMAAFLPGEAPWQRSLAGYIQWSHKRVRYSLAAKQQQQLEGKWLLLYGGEGLKWVDVRWKQTPLSQTPKSQTWLSY